MIPRMKRIQRFAVINTRLLPQAVLYHPSQTTAPSGIKPFLGTIIIRSRM
jgi:hypothetical protein